jgi:hypothetical protein
MIGVLGCFRAGGLASAGAGGAACRSEFFRAPSTRLPHGLLATLQVMSELDDKPAPKPIFAPPGSSTSPKLSVPDAAPRTSQDRASVSGEFLVIERPEPTTPPRYEPPEGVTPDDEPTNENFEPLRFTTGTVTQDDEDRDLEEAAANDPPTPPDSPAISLLPPPEPEPKPAAIEKPRARPPESPEPEPEPEPKPSAGKVVGLIAAIVAVAAIVVFTQRDRTSPTVTTTKIQDVPREQTAERPKLDLGARGTETGGTETGGTETGEPEPEPKPANPRDPSVIPPGTPDENAKAFVKLPVSIHDGPPIGGIGRSGIHIDAIATASGGDNNDCKEPTENFSVSVAEYVNVCFRVVHPREQESLRVIWEKDGKVTRRGRVRIPDLHAYTTRAYLLVRPEYVGRWRVRIVPEGEDGIDLAVAEFEITE